MYIYSKCHLDGIRIFIRKYEFDFSRLFYFQFKYLFLTFHLIQSVILILNN